MSLPDALKETGRIIPEYRVPTRILDSPVLSKVMTNKWATMFGAYHYSLLKSFGEVAKAALGAQEPAPGRTKAQEVAKGARGCCRKGFLPEPAPVSRSASSYSR